MTAETWINNFIPFNELFSKVSTMLISLLNSILITFMLTFSESKESDYFYLINKAEIAICDGQLVDGYRFIAKEMR